MSGNIDKEKASEASLHRPQGGLPLAASRPVGGLGACPQQAKKGRSPPAPQELFWDIDINVHACMNQKTPNDQKIPRMKTGKNI